MKITSKELGKKLHLAQIIHVSSRGLWCFVTRTRKVMAFIPSLGGIYSGRVSWKIIKGIAERRPSRVIFHKKEQKQLGTEKLKI